LTEALVKLDQVPLALISSDIDPGNKNVLDINVHMTGTYFILLAFIFKIKKKWLEIRLANAGRLIIKLPIRPSTIEELALIRFWLLKLSHTHFEYIDSYFCILNPEFLSVLNPRTGPRKILFHANEVVVQERNKAAIPAEFAQFLCARKIALRTPLLDEPHRNNLFRFIMGTRNALEKVCIRSYESNQGEFCEVLVNVGFNYF
jgi:hypothetical protein